MLKPRHRLSQIITCRQHESAAALLPKICFIAVHMCWAVAWYQIIVNDVRLSRYELWAVVISHRLYSFYRSRKSHLSNDDRWQLPGFVLHSTPALSLFVIALKWHKESRDSTLSVSTGLGYQGFLWDKLWVWQRLASLSLPKSRAAIVEPLLRFPSAKKNLWALSEIKGSGCALCNSALNCNFSIWCNKFNPKWAFVLISFTFFSFVLVEAALVIVWLVFMQLDFSTLKKHCKLVLQRKNCIELQSSVVHGERLCDLFTGKCHVDLREREGFTRLAFVICDSSGMKIAEWKMIELRGCPRYTRAPSRQSAEWSDFHVGEQMFTLSSKLHKLRNNSSKFISAIQREVGGKIASTWPQ